MLHNTLDLVEGWLEEAETDQELLYCLMEYAQGRGGLTMRRYVVVGARYFTNLQVYRMKSDGGGSWKA
jgi:hypothetical protein